MKQYIRGSKYNKQYIPDDVYDDNSDKWFDDHVASFWDAYAFIDDNLREFGKPYGLTLEADSEEFYVVLDNGDCPTVVSSRDILRMAKENWTYDEVEAYVYKQLQRMADYGDAY